MKGRGFRPSRKLRSVLRQHGRGAMHSIFYIIGVVVVVLAVISFVA
jgi:hypothetical protein